MQRFTPPHPVVRVLAGALVALGTSSCFLLPPQTPVDFCVAQAQSFCDLQFDCCTAAERQSDPLGLFNGSSSRRAAPSTAAECKDLVVEVCRAAVAQHNESLVEERIDYDAEEAVDCLEELAAAAEECDAAGYFEASGTWLTSLLDNGRPGVPGRACDNVVEAAVNTDDECFADYECEKGRCVVQNLEGEVSAEGECQGDEVATNPLVDVEFDICDGLEDNQP